MSRRLNIVALEILEGCNLFCDFCVRNAMHSLTNKIKIENLEKLIMMLDKFPEKPEIAITGGEPFLQQNLYEILNKVIEYGFKFSITTNATIINKNVISLLKSTKLFKHFIISIDSSIPETHDSIRGPKAFFRSMRFIEYIKEIKIPFAINMTVCDKNYLDVSNTIQFAKEIGAKDISVATVKPNGRGETTFNKEQLEVIAMQILENKYTISDSFKLWATDVTFFLYDMDEYRDDIRNGEFGSCSFGRGTLHVRANGDILGCTACEDMVLGNAFESDERTYLLNIWNEHRLLADVRSKKLLKGTCKNCEFVKFCGGCRCRAYGVSGDLFAADPYCPIVMEKEKESIIQ